MEYDEDVGLFNFVAGVVCGALLGASIALVLAPDSGRKTRRRIQRAAGDLRETAVDRWDEIADEVAGKVEEVFRTARGKLT